MSDRLRLDIDVKTAGEIGLFEFLKSKGFKAALAAAPAEQPPVCDTCGQNLNTVERNHYTVRCHKPGCEPSAIPTGQANEDDKARRNAQSSCAKCLCGS